MLLPPINCGLVAIVGPREQVSLLDCGYHQQTGPQFLFYCTNRKAPLSEGAAKQYHQSGHPQWTTLQQSKLVLDTCHLARTSSTPEPPTSLGIHSDHMRSGTTLTIACPSPTCEVSGPPQFMTDLQSGSSGEIPYDYITTLAQYGAHASGPHWQFLRPGQLLPPVRLSRGRQSRELRKICCCARKLTRPTMRSREC